VGIDKSILEDFAWNPVSSVVFRHSTKEELFTEVLNISLRFIDRVSYIALDLHRLLGDLLLYLLGLGCIFSAKHIHEAICFDLLTSIFVHTITFCVCTATDCSML